MGTFNEFIKNHSWEFFAQDKWKIDDRTTLSIGVRYDLEIIPLDETGNPLFTAGQTYPVDKNNFAPRIGFTRAFDDQGKSVIRAGYGMFYNRTILGAIDDALEFSKFTSSNVVNFPNASADPGPAAGRLPTDPLLVNGPVVNRAAAQSDVPAGLVGPQCRRRDLRLARSPAAVRAPGDLRLRSRADRHARHQRRLHSRPRTATCSSPAT